MRVGECMTREVQLVGPAQTVREAAQMMARIDAGFLPVGEGDRMIGMITDRDIAIRAVAEGRGPDVTVREVMTPDVRYCFEDDDVQDVAQSMAEVQVRRMPVVDRNKRLVGVISISDVAKIADPTLSGRALGDITQAGGLHTQH